ncbi:alanine racemase [Zoogloea sp.]|uniref:alanine racemase n=1 Tax=Zoogloea sp. TaxID=49181 RepID=UPI0035B1E501
MPRPIRASIDLEALRHNYLLAKQRAGHARAFAVVKANAYGHGLDRAIQALGTIADGFALLDLAEARQLRAAGLRQPIALLEGFFEPADIAEIARGQLIPAIHSEAQLAMLERAAPTQPIDVLLKINSGMNRLGFTAATFAPALARLRALPAVRGITLMTHFARADDEVGVAAQFDTFKRLTAGLDLPVSLANSAALLRFPEAVGNIARPGVMLYGGSPMPDLASAEQLGLRPVMTVTSEIIGVQQIAAGERVGYGGTFEASGPMRVGVVACGYADGYPRHAPTGTPILVGGRRTRTLGRVSMDMLACDLSHLEEAGIGSPVTLWGDGLPADEVASAAGTISYELFCALAPRVPVSVRGAAAVGA